MESLFKYLFFTLCLFTLGLACTTNDECYQCHYCDVISGQCRAVQPFTDPLNECGIRCDTPMVCGEQQYCVFKTNPSCDCDFATGRCKVVSIEPATHIHHPDAPLLQEKVKPVTISDENTFDKTVSGLFVDAFEVFHLFVVIVMAIMFMLIVHLWRRIDQLSKNPS